MEKKENKIHNTHQQAFDQAHCLIDGHNQWLSVANAMTFQALGIQESRGELNRRFKEQSRMGGWVHGGRLGDQGEFVLLLEIMSGEFDAEDEC
jgi:hypothetical protein